MTKILVIEDELAIRENILELLETQDFEAIGAENGRLGVQMATEQRPDLILCDVMMPELDGYDVLAALRSEPSTMTIPFIFLTARADKSDTRKGMELGADDYLTKPCKASELLRAVETRLEKQAAVDRQAQKKLDDLRVNITHSLPHELRTPLNGIMGLSNLLLEDLDSLELSEIREMVEQIHTSSERLYRLIQNFLLYAQLELVATNPERIQALRNCQVSTVQELIANQATQQARAANREADLQLKLQDSSVLIAANRLKKLVEELVDNAFKFSAPGTPVTVTTVVNRNNFILTVSDKGRGMTAEQIAEIGGYMQFERKLYEQQGTGLGLTLSKRIAELHGGKLTIESIPNQHTTVRVSLNI